ncbi:hypothetical protein JIQ42_01889 [Leishmania sp. Namibia]|uniref:hypothetical protein n=1 Tax=Leishmania sp. Namibia TaxID=2802991 RepID=UPI001B55A6E3|nr:hypothetical protein JIQ42_01889 [Leishmania sp. Namibia]
MSHRYEDAVLKGTALLLLDLPPALCSASQPLQKLFDTHYPDNGITRILMNTPPIRSTSGENVMECGAIFFASPKELWAMLDRVRVLLRTEDGALELRRGYLTLGVHEVLVEGVVTWGVEGRGRAVSAPRAVVPMPASTVAPNTKDAESSALSRSTPTAAPKPVSVPVTATEASSSAVPSLQKEVADPSRNEAPGGVVSCGVACQTVVVTLLLKEVYNRHRDSREDSTRARQGGVAASFPLSPFMVYQLLVGECRPRKIVLIECRHAVAKREWRALVELENAEVAAHVIRVFTCRVVEFVSELNTFRGLEHSRQPPGKGALPICAEVRYFVNCSYSVRKGQDRFLPNGDRNYHRTVAVRPFCSAELDLTNPKNLAKLQVRAPRDWKHDSHAIRPVSIREHESPDRVELFEKEGEPNQSASAAAQHKRYRSPSPRKSPRRARRSPSRSRSRSTRSSSSRSYTPASSSSSRRHRRRRRRHGRCDSDERWHAARSAAPREHQNTERVEARSIAAARYAPTQSQQLLHAKAEGICESASATPARPAVTYDSHGALPVGWRPIFSQEYQQTYYAYRDPNTGVETTTWERPVA